MDNPENNKPPVVNNSQPAPAPKKAGSNVLSIIGLVIGLAAVAASAYLFQQSELQKQQRQSLQANVSGALQRVDEQSSAVRDLQRLVDKGSNQNLQQQQALKKQISVLQDQLSSQQKRLMSLSTTDRADWLLAEAEYLMRLANQRLLMGKEVAGALDLLLAADDIIRELDDSALYPVREALADNMAALRAAGKFDIEGLYFELSAVAKQIEQLQLINVQQFQLPEPEIAPAENWQQRLEKGLAAAWARLSDYIRITKRDEVYQPLMSPEYEATVRQNVRLMIEQSQLALVSGKQRVYNDSLEKAKQWLTRYYTLDQNATVAVVENIDRLLQEKVEVTLPDISSSTRALKNYVETIHQIKTRKNNPTEPKADEDEASADEVAISEVAS